MGKIVKNLLILLLILAINSQFFVGISSAATDPNSYTTFRTVDKNSFNEYRYLITKEFFNIKSFWDVDGILDSNTLTRVKDLASNGFNFLPDNNLENANLLNNLNISIAKAIKYPTSDAAYIGLIKSIGKYLDESSIENITGKVIALPKEGNAPFNVTLRTNIVDPTGTTIPQYNYNWWMDLGYKKVNIGTGPSINYTFKEEGNFTVFVSVTSAHKNSKGYTDVIPFEDSVVIKVKEKIASLIIKVNSDRLGTQETLKFTPSQAQYGLLFDATSSIPTGSAKFTRTEWDFGNGVKKSYSGEPKIERIVYSREGDYDVKLTLKTNLGKTIEKDFIISVHDPIATINVSPSEGFLGDKFTISAKNVTNDTNLTYNWTIVDIIEDKVIFSKQTKLFTYNFPNKGHFNLKLEVNGIDSGNRNIDTKNIYINSRAPVANFNTSIPETNKPNRVLFNATDSFDPDFTDTGKLKYSWEIDGSRIKLEEANEFGSLGYYTFDTIGEHNVVLKVEDPDNIEGTKKAKVSVTSVLSVDFSANNRAIKRGESIRFEAVSPNASFFEWDFGDGKKSTGGVDDKISHKYEKTGIFTVKLKVIDDKGNSTIQTKVIYVGNGVDPVAVLNIGNSSNSISISKKACNGNDAYIVDRLTSVSFNSMDSIDIDGSNSGIDYSLKIGNNKYYSSSNVSHKFDELGCYPILLKVTSNENYNSDTTKLWVKVENIKPQLSALTTRVESLETDPVIVTVDAVGATDKDGVITSYLWYYYTDLDDEPQDFRSTVGPSTRFVLPKITGNYYFVVLLSDDSEERVSSEELGKKASLTLAGDNINVPIVELNTPDNSVAVFDEVIFNSKVQNILKQDLSKKVQFFWDFDGDGFYDLETKTPSVTYNYDRPGTYYAKLKVKYKGFSNTRNIEINVVNTLVPKFEYISIGNKFIFINKTTGAYDDISFDLGDGTKIKNEDYFEHTYRDGKSSHNVKILASDGNTVKKSEVKVSKNLSNLFKSKKSKNGIFITIPESDSKNEINVKERVEDISIYFSGDIKDYSEIGADINLDKDTDLNGGKDDDVDIFTSENSYLNIKLDKNKTQIIRVFVKDSDGVVIVSKDYKIIKDYIKVDEINLDDIFFEGVTELQKEQLEDLKQLVSSVVGDDRLLAKSYVSRLKDEWGDENERIKIIYEFDGFLNDSEIENKDEIIEKLQELLLKESDEANEKNIALRALQGLTSGKIICEYSESEYSSCKDYIDSTLQAIRNNDDVEQSIILGTTILNIIGTDTNLTTNQKLDYKATLQSLIYGSVENIPEKIVDNVIEDNTQNDNGSVVSSILGTIGYVLLGIIILLSLALGGFFLYNKFVNKNSDQSLEDFIAEKTGAKDDIFSEEKTSSEPSPLKDKEQEQNIKDDIFLEVKKEKPQSGILSPLEEKEATKKEEKKIEKKQEVKTEDVPDWLKGSFDEVAKKEEKKEEKSQSGILSPLEEKEATKKVEKVEEVKTEIKKDEKKPSSQPSPLEEKEQGSSKENKVVKKEETLDEITKVEDDNIPDWLKGSLEVSPKKEEKKPSSQPSPLEEKEQGQYSEKKEDKKVEPKKEDPKKEKKKRVIKKEVTKKSVKKPEVKKPKVKKEEIKKEEVKPESKKEDKSDLWDDGMDVPDWLKS